MLVDINVLLQFVSKLLGLSMGYSFSCYDQKEVLQVEQDNKRFALTNSL